MGVPLALWGDSCVSRQFTKFQSQGESGTSKREEGGAQVSQGAAFKKSIPSL